MCFSVLDSTCFDKLFANVECLGIVVATAVCLRPSLRERLR